MSIRELHRLLGPNIEHPSAFRNGAVTQGHDQYRTIAKKSADIRHRAATFVLVKVHPNSGQQYKVEFFSSGTQ